MRGPCTLDISALPHSQALVRTIGFWAILLMGENSFEENISTGTYRLVAIQLSKSPNCQQAFKQF